MTATPSGRAPSGPVPSRPIPSRPARVRGRVGTGVLRALRERLGAGGAERGDAVVELLGAALLLLLPLLYLVVTLGRVQAGAFAVEAAAREAARAVVTAESSAAGAARAEAAVGIALADQGFGADVPRHLTLGCAADPCLTPDAEIVVEVRARVPLPLVPAFAQDAVPLAVPVAARHVAVVDRYAAVRP